MAYNKKNKKVYLLFGKENEYLNKDSPGWSDFGGGEKTGESALDTALREGCEELNGFFGCEGDIKRLVKENLVISLNHDRYTTFLFQIDYDENLPIYFDNNYKFLKNHVNDLVRHSTNGLFEKSNIKWMTFDDMRKERNTFRSYYRNVVDVILQNENDITSKLQDKKKRTRIVKASPAPETAPAPTPAKTAHAHKTRRYNNFKYSHTKTKTTATVPHNTSKKRRRRRREEPVYKKWFPSW